jgi:hypothetical protein
VGEALVVARRLALRGLVLLAEMAAAGLLSRQRVAAHELPELEEVSDPPRLLQRLLSSRRSRGPGGFS